MPVSKETSAEAAVTAVLLQLDGRFPIKKNEEELNNGTEGFSLWTNMLGAGRETTTTTTLSGDGWLLAPWLRRRMNDEYPISAVNLLSHARFAFKYPAGGGGIIKENSFLSRGGFIHLFV